MPPFTNADIPQKESEAGSKALSRLIEVSTVGCCHHADYEALDTVILERMEESVNSLRKKVPNLQNRLERACNRFCVKLRLHRQGKPSMFAHRECTNSSGIRCSSVPPAHFHCNTVDDDDSREQ